jgi:hypothetical protein
VAHVSAFLQSHHSSIAFLVALWWLLSPSEMQRLLVRYDMWMLLFLGVRPPSEVQQHVVSTAYRKQKAVLL